MKEKRFSIKAAMATTIIILNLIIILVFVAYNFSSFDILAKRQADRLLSLLFERTDLYFHDFLSDATLFNELYCDQLTFNRAFLDGDLSKVQEHTYFIAEKIKGRYPQISTVSYGDELGRYLGYRINPDDTINLMLKDKRTNDTLTIFKGDRMDSTIVSQIQNYQPQERPWYAPARIKQITQWSDIYVNNDEIKELAISVLTPVFNDKQFYGVVTTDISLNNINQFLKNDTKIENGIATLTLENGAVSVKCPEDFSLLEYATISVRPEKMKFAMEPVEGFELTAQVKDYIYVGSVLKCIVSLPNGNELKIERLAGQELPEIGSRCFPYWEAGDAVLIHNESHYIFEELNNIRLA